MKFHRTTDRHPPRTSIDVVEDTTLRADNHAPLRGSDTTSFGPDVLPRSPRRREKITDNQTFHHRMAPHAPPASDIPMPGAYGRWPPGERRQAARDSNKVNTLRNEPFRLLTLGRLALVAADGSEDASLATRRRKLALLAVLATAGRPLPRAVLAAMFWGDQDKARARHSLSDALSHLRRVLGRHAIASRQSDIWISPDCRLTVDARELAAAAAARDDARVVALYAGPFMDGFSVPGSCTFEQWTARERNRLARLFVAACDGRCFALARTREWEACAALSARWLGLAPLSVDAALYRLNALKAPLTRDAFARALAVYDHLVRRLRDEYERAPDPRLTTLANDIAASLCAVVAPAVVEAAAAPPPSQSAPAAQADVSSPPSPTPRRLGRAARWVTVTGSIGITLLLAGAELARAGAVA